jgi:hypothetical protein
MEDYSNRELDRMFGEIMETCARIEAQTTKTNGRVKALEMWRMFLLGGLGVITSLVIPLVIYIFLHK